MAVQSREDLTYAEIYRPVEQDERLATFLDRVRFSGDEVFGTRINTLVTEPAVLEGEDGLPELVNTIQGVDSPRLEVYGSGQIRLPLLDRRIEPRLNYGGRFRWAVGRLLTKPGDTAYRPVPRSAEEERGRTEKRKRDSLDFIFEQIGLKYGIEDQHHLEIPIQALDIPVDPPLEHLGSEVQLVPDPKSKVTRMLVEHAGVCLRGLGRHSPKAANPYSPTGLRIPFARMPSDATESEIEHFLGSVEENLPHKLALGYFKDHVGGSSWQRVRR